MASRILRKLRVRSIQSSSCRLSLTSFPTTHPYLSLGHLRYLWPFQCPYYCYISFLFSCIYVGVAKLTSLNFTLSEAFVDSLFMPFAWSALPSNLTIKFVAGLQATCVSIIGYNILFRHLGNRLDRITKTANKLCEPISREAFKARMNAVERLLSQVPTVSKTSASKNKMNRKKS